MDFQDIVKLAATLRETVSKPLCFDEGRAAALQGINFAHGNPYYADIEPESHRSWTDGWLSVEPHFEVRKKR
jgi:hypothetical protein